MRPNRFSLLVLSILIVCFSPSTRAAETPPIRAGLLLTPAVFTPAPLSRSFQNDKIRDALGYGDNDPVRAVDLDLNDDGKPERFIVAAERLCDVDGCPYTLLDAKSMRDIGNFTGALVVLNRRQNGWSVIQTIGRKEDGLSNLTSFVFNRAQYQPDESGLIDEVTLESLLQTLSRQP